MHLVTSAALAESRFSVKSSLATKLIGLHCNQRQKLHIRCSLRWGNLYRFDSKSTERRLTNNMGFTYRTVTETRKIRLPSADYYAAVGLEMRNTNSSRDS